MPAQLDVSRHYTHGGLTHAIRDELAWLGKASGTVTVDDLAPVDEFPYRRAQGFRRLARSARVPRR